MYAQCLEQDFDIVISSYICAFIIIMVQCCKISRAPKRFERRFLGQRAEFIVADRQLVSFFFIIHSTYSTACCFLGKGLELGDN